MIVNLSWWHYRQLAAACWMEAGRVGGFIVSATEPDYWPVGAAVALFSALTIATAMPENAFIGKPEPPTDVELAEALASTKKLWDRLVAILAHQRAVTVQAWKAYSRKSGWTLRLKRKDRTVVYLSPYRGSFLAAFALGDRAVAAARKSHLPEWAMKIIADARRYAEGTVVRIEVKRAKELRVVELLAAINISAKSLPEGTGRDLAVSGSLNGARGR